MGKNSKGVISLKKEQIKEIADLLDSGMKCFYSIKSDDINFFPDFISQEYADPGEWQEFIDEIDEHFDEYIGFIPMPSQKSFDVMELFIDEIDDTEFKNRLKWILSRQRPFRNFKDEIDYNEKYRQQWFDFKLNKNIEWVEEQLESYINRPLN